LGVLFSSIGLGFFVYGKKQKALVPTLCGLSLMLVPYFITSIPILLAIGIALCVAPIFDKPWTQ
jgi:hypothetical protein